MAVYTTISPEALKAFMTQYDLGEAISCEGIAEGVENSNYLLATHDARYILTLYEKRVKAEELPWFLGLMRHLASRALPCPTPVAGRDGESLRSLMERPAAITTFLLGRPVDTITPEICRALGKALADFHELGRDYPAYRSNALGPEAWKPLLVACGETGDELRPGLTHEVSQAIDDVIAKWPDREKLPHGQIHADLFPDNVFFQGERVSGIIDFYFACTDLFAYDLAICINAWCFPDEQRLEPILLNALLRGYEAGRELSAAERQALIVLSQGAALRFLLTRLYDWGHTSPDALVTRKDPLVYLSRLRTLRRMTEADFHV
ncbi:homoserine kinase [Kozakia baliensis]|uniref:homoserine kinase n=1 Tax=Kozakia baliensis TaxID=153496 RepID=UPI00087C73DC|nr:homoserine kinase [Kozakia baliensis]AOX19597.1 homoserine kinase [Kozakia baliensis]